MNVEHTVQQVGPEATGHTARKIPRYRSDVDGLRAFSIIAVIIFHAFPKMAPGGYIGVDVFFVISGYLISGIILRSIDAEGSVNYGEFYVRRIKRIFPSLIVVLAAMLSMGWAVMFPDEWRSLGKHTAAGAMFSSNLVLMREGGYFDLVQKPLLHLWSLGVEEQFYIVWPILLSIAWRRKVMTSFLIVTIIGSLLLSVWIVNVSQNYAFYLPVCRFWELASGALLSVREVFIRGKRAPQVITKNATLARSGFSLLGAILLALSVVVISKRTLFPGAWAMLPVCGAVLTIGAGPSAWFNRAVLSRRVLVMIGLISYPLYLWHWPVLIVGRMIGHGTMQTRDVVAAVCAAVALAWLTYRYVELPIRQQSSPKWVPWVLSYIMAGLAIVGAVAFYRGGARLGDSPGARMILDAEGDWHYPFDFNANNNGEFKTGQIGNKNPSVLFVGDSHAEQWFPRIQALLVEDPANMPTTEFATYGGCPPLPGVRRATPGYRCAEFWEFEKKKAESSSIRAVAFSAYWELYFGYAPDTGGERIIEPSIGWAWSSVKVADDGFSGLAREIERLVGMGKKVYVILSNPTGGYFDPHSVVSRVTGLPIRLRIDDYGIRRQQPIIDLLRSAAERAGATIIDPMQRFCDDSGCSTSLPDGRPIYKDANHVRASIVAQHATFIDQIVQGVR